MSTTMAKEPKKPNRGRPPVKEPLTISITTKVTQSMAKALDDYCSAQRIPPDRPEVMRVALEEFLIAEGYLPQKEPKPSKEKADE